MKKAIPLLILAFAILSIGVLSCRAAAKPRINVAQAEPCIGFGCWPIDLPIKHRLGEGEVGSSIGPRFRTVGKTTPASLRISEILSDAQHCFCRRSPSKCIKAQADAG